MPDDLTTTAPAGEAPEGDGTEDPVAKAIADARLRQGGAERARQEAERLLQEANRTIEALKSGKPADQTTVDVKEAIKQALAEQRAEFEKTLSEATAKAQGEALDARFPAARAKFPEITDTVKLAELEGMFGEAPADAPVPVGNSQQRATGSGQKSIEDMSVAELKEHMKKLPREAMGLPTTT